MTQIPNSLERVLADTYALYLKTQNYHWHVKGPNFKSLHELFEVQYKDLADAIDVLAERLRALDATAPATFKALDSLKTIDDGDANVSSHDMVQDLVNSQQQIIKLIHDALKIAESENDEGTIGLLTDRVTYHEKARWMLRASL